MSLARAIYSRASVLLLDDIISAVDAETSQHIVQHCFKSTLMAGRTVIIASHAVETLAPLANQAMFLDNGRAIWQGNGHELLDTEHMAHLKGTASKTVPTLDPMAESEKILPASSKMDTIGALEIKEAVSKTPKQLIIDEQQSKGDVDMNHWWDLIALSGGHAFWGATIVILAASCLAPVAHRKVLQ